jgi:hypothetical protein
MTADFVGSGVEWVCLKVVARHAGQTSSWLNPDAQSLIVNATWNVMIINLVHLLITQYYSASMKRSRISWAAKRWFPYLLIWLDCLWKLPVDPFRPLRARAFGHTVALCCPKLELIAIHHQICLSSFSVSNHLISLFSHAAFRHISPLV